LEFICQGTEYFFDIASIPSNLTTLILAGVHFTQESRSELQLQPLPHLTSLSLKSTHFEGRIQEYLKFSELKNLELSSVRFFLPEDNNPSPQEKVRRTAEMLPEAAFFEGIPKLERLVLKDIPANGAFATVLQNCSSLQHLIIESCSIRAFIPSFLMCLPNNQTFPLLKALRIDDSWPAVFNISYPELARYCIGQRPGIEVAGNGNQFRAWSQDFSDFEG
jgi:hypothetical protein